MATADELVAIELATISNQRLAESAKQLILEMCNTKEIKTNTYVEALIKIGSEAQKRSWINKK